MKEEIAPTQVMKLLEADFMQGTESKPYSQNDVKFLKLVERTNMGNNNQYPVIKPTCVDTEMLTQAEKEILKHVQNEEFPDEIPDEIRQLRCDRGTNIVGAEAELKKALKEMNHDPVKSHLLKEGCDYIKFNFNPPAASHMGGVWERRVLEALLQQHGRQLDDEALCTLMCEVMAIVNSRPLTVDFINDGTSTEPLTPNHLLTQKSR